MIKQNLTKGRSPEIEIEKYFIKNGGKNTHGHRT